MEYSAVEMSFNPTPDWEDYWHMSPQWPEHSAPPAGQSVIIDGLGEWLHQEDKDCSLDDRPRLVFLRIVSAGPFDSHECGQHLEYNMRSGVWPAQSCVYSRVSAPMWSLHVFGVYTCKESTFAVRRAFRWTNNKSWAELSLDSRRTDIRAATTDKPDAAIAGPIAPEIDNDTNDAADSRFSPDSSWDELNRLFSIAERGDNISPIDLCSAYRGVSRWMVGRLRDGSSDAQRQFVPLHLQMNDLQTETSIVHGVPFAETVEMSAKVSRNNLDSCVQSVLFLPAQTTTIRNVVLVGWSVVGDDLVFTRRTFVYQSKQWKEHSGMYESIDLRNVLWCRRQNIAHSE